MAEIAAIAALCSSASSGLNLGEITAAYKVHREAFKQDRRLFYAEYTEAVAHHGEEYAQAERHHSESFPHAEAGYWQSARHHRRDVDQARLQNRLMVEEQMQAEIRGMLRDDFEQKINRFDALMVCQTLMLGQAGQLSYITGPVPTDWRWITFVYTAMVAGSLVVLTLSMWFNYVCLRRLNEYTPGELHVLMHQDAEWLKRKGKDDVFDAILVREQFVKWFKEHCSFMGTVSMHLFTVGVLTLFSSVGILLQCRLQACRPLTLLPLHSPLHSPLTRRCLAGGSPSSSDGWHPVLVLVGHRIFLCGLL